MVAGSGRRRQTPNGCHGFRKFQRGMAITQQMTINFVKNGGKCMVKAKFNCCEGRGDNEIENLISNLVESLNQNMYFWLKSNHKKIFFCKIT
jgi:hypothetical protein